MKTIHDGKIIPDYIIRRETETTDEGKTRDVITLLEKFDYTSRAFLRKCMSYYFWAPSQMWYLFKGKIYFGCGMG